MSSQDSVFKIHLPAEEIQLWQHMAVGDKDAREKLIAMYQPLARKIAATLYINRHIQEFEFNDFHQYALVGLIESIDRYNPKYETKFSSYASHRIKGCILNGVEKQSEKQQQILSRKRILAERAGTLKSGKNNTRDFESVFAEMAEIAIGLALGYMLEDSGIYCSEDGETQPDTAYAGYELKQLKERVKAIVDALPDQERSVIKHHYFQGIKFDEIAMEMNLTKGRISQIHHSAINRLRILHIDLIHLNKTF